MRIKQSFSQIRLPNEPQLLGILKLNVGNTTRGQLISCSSCLAAGTAELVLDKGSVVADCVTSVDVVDVAESLLATEGRAESLNDPDLGRGLEGLRDGKGSASINRKEFLKAWTYTSADLVVGS